MKKKGLFSAPFSFLGDLVHEFESLIDIEFREIWTEEQVEPDKDLNIWMPNPGQKFTIDQEILDRLPALELLITPSTGTNHIDKAACQTRGIQVFCLLDERKTLDSISASAEFTFLLLLNSLRRLDLALPEVTERRWRAKEDMMRGNELNAKKVGLVGMGRIGHRLAKWCTAFDAEVAYYDPYVEESEYPRKTLPKLFSESDVVCVCCLLTEETQGIINKELISSLKQNACLVNTSRGEVVNEQDLYEVIQQRSDLRIALDVLSGEVSNTHFKSPLIDLHDAGRIVITPHIAGATYESQTKAALGALNLLKMNLI